MEFDAFVQNTEETHQHTKFASAMAQIKPLSTGNACASTRYSLPQEGSVMEGRAGLSVAPLLVLWAPSVITSPSCCPSLKGPGSVGDTCTPGNLGSSSRNIIPSPDVMSALLPLSCHAHSNSLNTKLAPKEYNMQSVNICSLVLVDSLSKGINNNIDICLLSSFLSTSRNPVTAITSLSCVLNDVRRNETMYIGAFPKDEEINHSQLHDEHDVLVLNSYLTNRDMDDTSVYIPLDNDNAILNTENTIASFTRPTLRGQPDTYKSDYAFNNTNYIILSSIQESEPLSGIASDKNFKSKNVNVSTVTDAEPMLRATRSLKDVTFAQLLELQRSEKARMACLIRSQQSCNMSMGLGPASNTRWGIPRAAGLCGGGESSLNNGSTGWGSPPGPNTNVNAGNWGNNPTGQGGNQQQWNSGNSQGGPQRPPPSQADNTNKQNPVQPNATPSGAPPNSNIPPNAQNWNTAPGQGGPPGGPPKLPSNAPIAPGVPNAGGNGNVNPPISGVLPPNNGTAAPGVPPAGGAVAVAGSASAKNQLEQLNTMREALFSQDGWGGQHVNQDTNWDVPGSPEPPGAKVPADPAGGPPVWKPNVNNGTDLWEANLRNGGQPPPQPTQKTPWGHTPTTNLGGTWGEDDDPSDSANVWTGGPSTGQPPPQWGNAQQIGAKKDNDWNGNNGAAGGGGNGSGSGSWVDPRGVGGAMDPREQMRTGGVMGGDPRDLRSSSGDARDMRGMMLSGVGGGGDPRDPIRGMGADPRNPMADMRGDPRGISGRLNGTSEMWGHHMGHQMPPNKMVPGGGNGQWTSGPPPKDMSMGVSGKPSGWEEPSPPAQRRSMPNFDDGTSLWGGGGQPPTRMGGMGGASGASNWKEMGGPGSGMGRAMGGAIGPGMGGPNRMPGSASGMKPDGMWSGGVGGHMGRNGSWEDGPHNWEDKSLGGGSWSEGPVNPNWGGSGPKGGAKTPMGGGGGWDSEMSDWGGPHGLPKPTIPKPTKEYVWNSKQFRMLVDMGFKKEDVEQALRARDMNMDEAGELLSQLRGGGSMDTWGRHREENGPFEHNTGGGFPNNRYPQPNMPFPPGNGPTNLLNNMGGGGGGGAGSNPGLASISNISPAVMHKMLNQCGPGSSQSSHPFSQSSNNHASSQPSTQQLRMLVQQIQMAVQAGYLNNQILNQPLAPQTLVLLNQLLQQIKALQQLVQQLNAMGPSQRSNNGLHISVQITKTKQQIQNLQNQIAAQQALYVKGHVGGGGSGNGPGGQDFFKSSNNLGGHDPISGLQGNFSEMSMNKDTSVQGSQQSRLTQWKLPALDKEDVGDFSRAPGASKALNTSPGMNPLGLGPGDGTWSSGRSVNDGWPSDVGGDLTDGKDWPVATQASPAFTDLVPEFEPGKPWKGTQIKSIEDDPSMTPGSVVRSPLSIASIKDSEIFTTSKTSPTTAADLQPLSLSNSTWSFNPPSTQSSFSSGKLSSKSSWSDSAPPPTATTSELWGAPINKARGPPPGLGNKAGGVVGVGNSWGGLGSRGGSNASSNWSAGGAGNTAKWQSTWLLLKNLTAQIDGSTLKTLCMQHGPLQSFHLYLNHGFALAKYSTREEASKAQTALNNCVLGNTTIFADNPGDSDVQHLLQSLGHGAPQAPSQSSQSSWRPASQQPLNNPGSDTWGSGSVWPSSNGGSLWTSPLDGGNEQRGTPSGLNSFLPGDLLGGESM